MSNAMRCVFLFCILFAAGRAYLTMPKEERFARGADEGYYFRYAKEISNEGLGHFSKLLEVYLDDPRAQLFPHPGRFGHTLIAALWFKIFPDTYRSLAHLSFLCFLVFLGVSFFFCRKYLGTDMALWYTTLLASSPLMMAASRRLLQDSLLNLFWALPFWLFFDYLMTKRRRSLVVYCVTLIVAITIKEASLALIFCAAVAWLVFKFHYQRDLPPGDFLITIFVPSVVSLVVVIIVLGGFANFSLLADFLVSVHFSANPSNTYAIFATGPWFKFLVDFMLLSSVVTVLFIGYFFYLLAVRKFNQIQAYGLIFFTIVFGIFSSLQHTKIVRFVMSLEIVLCLFAVLALQELLRFKSKPLTRHLTAAAVILIFLTNISNYNLLYCRQGIYDAVSVWLLLAKKFIPYFQLL